MELDFTKHKGIVTKRTSDKEYRIYPIKNVDNIEVRDMKITLTSINDLSENIHHSNIIRIGKVSELSKEDIEEIFSPCLPVTIKGDRFGYRSSNDMFKSISKELGSEYGVITMVKLKGESIDDIKSRNT